jgi:hypothetical protein
VNSATWITENPRPQIDSLSGIGAPSGSRSDKGAYIRLAPSGGLGVPFSKMIDPQAILQDTSSQSNLNNHRYQ